MNRYKILWIL